MRLKVDRNAQKKVHFDNFGITMGKDKTATNNKTKIIDMVIEYALNF